MKTIIKQKFKEDSLMNKKIEFHPTKLQNYFGEIKIKNGRFKISNGFGTIIRDYNQHQKCIRSIQIIEESSKLISSSQDGTIKIWDLETGECLKTLEDHADWVTSILIHNSKLITCSSDKTIKIWNLDNYQCIETLNNYSSVSCLLSLSNDFLASGLGDCSINIWNLTEKNILKTIKAHTMWISFLTKTHDFTKLISCSDDKTIKIWSLESFKLLKELNGHSDRIICLKVLNNGHLLSGSVDQTIRLWTIDLGECLQIINFNGSVNLIETFNNNEMLIIGIGSGKIEGNDIIIYDLNKNEEVKRFTAHSSFVSKFNLLSNGNLLTSSGNGEIKLWNLLEFEFV